MSTLFLRALVDLLLPAACRACKKEKAAFPLPVCCGCKRKAISDNIPVRAEMREVDTLWSCAAYSGALKECLKDLKFNGNRAVIGLVGKLARRFLEQHPEALENAEVLVPVPAYPSRRRQRGYNQAHLIAMAVSEISGIPCSDKLLLKKRDTAPQARLSLARRRNNLDGAFAAPEPLYLKGKHVVVVDDIMTSGATIRSCSSTLRKAGVSRVTGLVVARVV